MSVVEDHNNDCIRLLLLWVGMNNWLVGEDITLVFRLSIIDDDDDGGDIIVKLLIQTKHIPIIRECRIVNDDIIVNDGVNFLWFITSRISLYSIVCYFETNIVVGALFVSFHNGLYE